MTAVELLDALQLPPASRVDRRVAKTLLTEHGAPTAADKRAILDGIEEVRWLAALKPTTIAVPDFQDVERSYVEIAVLSATLRQGSNPTRLTELLHRAVPHPLLLVCDGAQVGVSLAHKRRALNEADKVVLDGDVVAATWQTGVRGDIDAEFLQALSLLRQPKASLRALYQGWIDSVLALEAARRTGTFALAASAQAAQARLDALRECRRLDTQVARLRAAGRGEKQLAKAIDINLELQRLASDLAALRARL